MGVADAVLTVRSFVSVTICNGGTGREEGGGALKGIFLLRPAPNERLLLNPADPLLFAGEEGVEFGPQDDALP